MQQRVKNIKGLARDVKRHGLTDWVETCKPPNSKCVRLYKNTETREKSNKCNSTEENRLIKE
jgi:hypothetical protein